MTKTTSRSIDIYEKQLSQNVSEFRMFKQNHTAEVFSPHCEVADLEKGGLSKIGLKKQVDSVHFDLEI